MGIGDWGLGIPNNLKRVKAHATKRELQLSFLIVSANWRFSGTRI